MSMFSRILGRKRSQVTDAKRLYCLIMAQSRDSRFFGEGRLSDSYEGRIEALTLHQSAMMYTLRTYGENGERLSQALFDVMVDDFDTALRGEGLTDSGVKRRIKPIVELFYARLKAYTEGLNAGDMNGALSGGELKNVSPEFSAVLAQYCLNLVQSLSNVSLGDLALAKFSFPDLTKE